MYILTVHVCTIVLLRFNQNSKFEFKGPHGNSCLNLFMPYMIQSAIQNKTYNIINFPFSHFQHVPTVEKWWLMTKVLFQLLAMSNELIFSHFRHLYPIGYFSFLDWHYILFQASIVSFSEIGQKHSTILFLKYIHTFRIMFSQ